MSRFTESLRPSSRVVTIAAAFWLATLSAGAAQDPGPPTLRAAALGVTHRVDGLLDEPAWSAASAVDTFRQTDPTEGARPTGRTSVRVLAGSKAIVIGITCDDPNPAGIASYSVRRDANLGSEDHVRIVLGPSMDGRSGYVFAVNPSGARYDGLINPGGESENAEWDGIWEAGTRRTAEGWTVELRIPVQTLSFNASLRQWHLNIQRRIQRVPETSRWASPVRQYQVTQTSRAGLLTNLPEFDLGVGLSVRPSVAFGGGIPRPGTKAIGEFQPSIDLTQRIGANVVGSATVNTDFAETEVDTRRTNLTRFPLFFPEKRTFFLEGDDIFAFGLGLNQDVLPYFSRRIGLIGGQEVPIIIGNKVNGRAGNTNFGALLVGTGKKEGVIDDGTFMAVGRVKQNLWRESWVGAIASTGDPLARGGSWLAGADFTYATSRFRGDKNLLAGVWGLSAGRSGPEGDTRAYGFKVDYPNDQWDVQLTAKRVGRDFDPSLGFVPRRGVYLYNGEITNRVRLGTGPIQQLVHEFIPTLATDLRGQWESYRVFMAPVNWRFRTGDRFELNANPTGERLVAPFEIASGVTIAAGSYHWVRYRVEVGTAQKRRLYSQVTWWLGGFYDGTLQQVIWTGAWNPTPLITVEFNGERNTGRVAAGRISQTLVGNRVRVNVSSDLSLATYVQYDTDSKSVGVNTRVRWTLTPVTELFVVYNHNMQSVLDRWQLQSNQLLVKFQHAWRF